MNRMSDLLRLEEIRKQNGDIKAFPLSSNMKSAKHGKGTWGDITIAIDAESVEKIMQNNVVGVLYLVGKDDWRKKAKRDEL